MHGGVSNRLRRRPAFIRASAGTVSSRSDTESERQHFRGQPSDVTRSAVGHDGVSLACDPATGDSSIRSSCESPDEDDPFIVNHHFLASEDPFVDSAATRGDRRLPSVEEYRAAMLRSVAYRRI